MKSLPSNHRAEQNRLLRRRSMYFRAAWALILVPGITAYCVWMIQGAAQRAFKQSTPGRIVRLYDQIAPQVDQHNQEIQELSKP